MHVVIANDPLYNRDGEELAEISANLSFPSLGLDEEGSYSCAGVNYLGIGEFTTVVIDVIGRLFLLGIPTYKCSYFLSATKTPFWIELGE